MGSGVVGPMRAKIVPGRLHPSCRVSRPLSRRSTRLRPLQDRIHPHPDFSKSQLKGGALGFPTVGWPSLALPTASLPGDAPKKRKDDDC